MTTLSQSCLLVSIRITTGNCGCLVRSGEEEKRRGGEEERRGEEEERRGGGKEERRRGGGTRGVGKEKGREQS